VPAVNEADMAELPPEVEDGMRFVPVHTLEEVLTVALPREASPT
jgi:ATP-dependent Lon protease